MRMKNRRNSIVLKKNQIDFSLQGNLNNIKNHKFSPYIKMKKNFV